MHPIGCAWSECVWKVIGRMHACCTFRLGMLHIRILDRHSHLQLLPHLDRLLCIWPYNDSSILCYESLLARCIACRHPVCVSACCCQVTGFPAAVTDQIQKLASINLCPNLSGQICCALMMNPPQVRPCGHACRVVFHAAHSLCTLFCALRVCFLTVSGCCFKVWSDCFP